MHFSGHEQLDLLCMVYVLFQCGQSLSKVELQHSHHTATPRKRKYSLLVTAPYTTASGVFRQLWEEKIITFPYHELLPLLTFLQNLHITISHPLQSSGMNLAILKIINKIMYKASKYNSIWVQVLKPCSYFS